ncbi:MAG TPA: SMP-30/gluconolactonase/LRE family protein [Saprospiraceae bacterium]|nr:SMP-30/gluconolactonase/LRE family protein [Saprospiraceae bacterium]
MASPALYQTLSVPTSLLGEGPVWDEQNQRIYWVDILNGLIYTYHPVTRAYRQWEVPGMVGAIALCEDGRMITALRSGFVFVDLDSGAVEPIIDPEAHLSDNRFNDGKCDPAGRFWAGTMDTNEQAATGSLYSLSADLNCTKRLSAVTISNGLAWTSDHKTMYYIDTPTLSVAAFDFELATGAITNRRTVIEIPEEEGFPDGMCIDTEDKLWIAHWGGWQVARWDPLGGKKLSSIRLPAAQITSCAFGGIALEDLYITSAKVGLSEAQQKEQTLAGSLFVIENCGYQGRPATRFKTDNL